jgi:hypothetical protein
MPQRPKESTLYSIGFTTRPMNKMLLVRLSRIIKTNG